MRFWVLGLTVKYIVLIVSLGVVLVSVCWSGEVLQPQPDWSKIRFDLDIVDNTGLTGPPSGKRALSYEFCIPNDQACKDEVSSIDPTVRFMCGSSGRVGCSNQECLCVGSTYQQDHRSTLAGLTQMEYIKEIRECFFE